MENNRSNELELIYKRLHVLEMFCKNMEIIISQQGDDIRDIKNAIIRDN